MSFKACLNISVKDINTNDVSNLLLSFKTTSILFNDKEYPLSYLDKLELRVEDDYSFISIFKDSKLILQSSKLKLNDAYIEKINNIELTFELGIYENDKKVENVDFKSMSYTLLEEYVNDTLYLDKKALKYLAIEHYFNNKDTRDLDKAKEILEDSCYEDDDETQYYLYRVSLFSQCEHLPVDVLGTIKHISWCYKNQFMPLVNSKNDYAVKNHEKVREEIFSYYTKIFMNNHNEIMLSKQHHIIGQNVFMLAYINDKGNLEYDDISLLAIDDDAMPFFDTEEDVIFLSYGLIKSKMSHAKEELNGVFEMSSDDALNIQILETIKNAPNIDEEILNAINDYINSYNELIFFEKNFSLLH